MEAQTVRWHANGRPQKFDGDTRMPLLWVLREQLGLTGTKYGCGVGQCGACTVHVDGHAARACTLPMSALEGKQVLSIEGLTSAASLHPVQQAWIDEDVAQCGYCQAGQIMAAVALLNRNSQPSDADIDGIGNLCRCGTQVRIRKAIARAAAALKGGR